MENQRSLAEISVVRDLFILSLQGKRMFGAEEEGFIAPGFPRLRE